MKTAIVANFPVGPKFNGGAMTVWGLVNALIEKGDQIYLILLCEKNTEKKIYTECINILAQYNIKFEMLVNLSYHLDKYNSYPCHNYQ